MTNKKKNVEVFSAYSRVPYALISQEIDSTSSDVLNEFGEIIRYYNIYENGAKFTTEGSKGDYVPSDLAYRTSASLINKEARFLFGETPDVIVRTKGNESSLSKETKDAVSVLQELVSSVLKENRFSRMLVQAARDCFIGKRVAGVINFNEDDGITFTFLNSLSFIYETDLIDTDKLTKFVSFSIVRNRTSLNERRIYKKKFQIENDGLCYLEEILYDGLGSVIEIITEYQPTKFNRIPAVVITNDGLTGDILGESEIEILQDFESLYSKLSNADVDAERKGMNQVVYTIDMDDVSTKGLGRSPGSYWDLQSNDLKDDAKSTVGTIDNNMSYSDPLSKTLDRIKMSMYEQVEVPNINLDTMRGTITSGKALKAIYWPLIVRCKEKMKIWGPQLEYLIEIIIEGALLYPNTIKKYITDHISPVSHEVNIVSNYPLPEDEIEEKEMDLAEVGAKVLSRSSYMKKWRELTDSEIAEELKQIAIEQEMFENGYFGNDIGFTTDQPVDADIEEVEANG